jgi:hypothetical protein
MEAGLPMQSLWMGMLKASAESFEKDLGQAMVK